MSIRQIVFDVVIAYFSPAAGWNSFTSCPRSEILFPGGSCLNCGFRPVNCQVVRWPRSDTVLSSCISLWMRILCKQNIHNTETLMKWCFTKMIGSQHTDIRLLQIFCPMTFLPLLITLLHLSCSTISSSSLNKNISDSLRKSNSITICWIHLHSELHLHKMRRMHALQLSHNHQRRLLGKGIGCFHFCNI